MSRMMDEGASRGYRSPVLQSRSIFDRLQVFFSPVSAPLKRRLSTNKFFKHPSFLTRKMSFISICCLNSFLLMWELTKRISLRISSVLSEMEPEPDLYTGSDQKIPAPQHCRAQPFIRQSDSSVNLDRQECFLQSLRSQGF